VHAPGRDNWSELVPASPDERLVAVDAFQRHLVLTLRRGASAVLRVLRRDGYVPPYDVEAGEGAGSIRLACNEEFDTSFVTIVVESFTEPPAWYDVDLDTGARTLRKRKAVPGYDASAYVSERIWAPQPDGARVPVTIVRRADTPLDGTAPCLLYGYGAYESCEDPAFDLALPSLLDRGVVYAVAHVRGGGELGRTWWEAGRLRRKQTTFADFIGVADWLAGEGLVDGSRIVSRGLSAGGLLQGAAYSQRPDRWRAVVAEVPFVDVVTTMLDADVPLTINEWDEWGDPRDPDDFAAMLSYSPYDNVPVGARPPLLVTGALHDPRVLVHEPAKWVAKLRASDGDGTAASRVLFRVELGEGAHTGPAGRFGHLRYETEVYAFILDAMGLG
jgi:oligopeptidase B